MFRLSNVSKKYVSQGIETCAINGITMELDKKIIAIVGRSGSGKTTLLNLLSTNDDATEGEIYYNDMNLVQINDKEKELLRLNRFGFVFQQFELIQSLNVHDNIVLPAVFAKKKDGQGFLSVFVKSFGNLRIGQKDAIPAFRRSAAASFYCESTLGKTRGDFCG